MKQIGLGVLQYVQDYDETYPVGWDGSGPFWGAKQTWCGRIAPYIKSVAVFSCPDDGLQGTPSTPGIGTYISYAGNAYHSVTAPHDAANELPNTGVFGFLGQGGSWGLQPTVTTLASNPRPTETIMIAEKWASDVQKVNVAGGNSWDLMTSAFSASCLFQDYTEWPNYVNNIPSGGASGPYPTGQNGGVSVHSGNVSNFAFCDGHVKAMQPLATDPDIYGQPQNDMWDSTRQ